MQPEASPTIPVSERFPRLASRQVRFTTAAAIKNLDQSERHVYRIVAKLKSRSGNTFSQNNNEGIPWTFAVRDFLSMIQIYDDNAMILPRRENANINSISGYDEVPDSTDVFERDYAWNTRMQGPYYITMNLMMATTKDCNSTFKRGEIFQRLKENDWFVNLDRLETQQIAARVGFFLFAHNRWANHDDILGEVKDLIAPLQCTDMDIRVDRPVRTYYAKDATIEIEHGRQKKLTIITKWPTLYAPLDIATTLKEKLVQEWPRLQTSEQFDGYNCKRYIFIPATPSPRSTRNKNFTAQEKRNFASYLHYMRKQNIFLNRCSQVVVLQNVGNIYANFEWTEDMAVQLGGGNEKIGLKQPLRSFLLSITRTNNPTERTIHSIHREVTKGTFSLLVNNDDAADLRVTINRLVPLLKATPAFSKIRVGGTNGAFHDGKFEVSSIGYIAQLGTSDEFVCEPTVLDAGGDSTMDAPPPVRAIDFNTPPNMSRNSRGRSRGSNSTSRGPARWVRPTANAAAMNYRDVLTSQQMTNPYSQQVSTTMTRSNTPTSTQTSSITTLQSPQPAGHLTVDSLSRDAQFKQMLSDIIAPHLQPALQEVRTLQSAMTTIQERHNIIEANVASLATLGPKFDHMLSMMGNLTQMSSPQLQTQAPMSPAQPPQKRFCGDGQQPLLGTLNPNADIDFSGPLHPQENDEDEAGRQR
jgi:hypothetical protein